jgi:hypothetical protein
LETFPLITTQSIDTMKFWLVVLTVVSLNLFVHAGMQKRRNQNARLGNQRASHDDEPFQFEFSVPAVMARDMVDDTFLE